MDKEATGGAAARPASGDAGRLEAHRARLAGVPLARLIETAPAPVEAEGLLLDESRLPLDGPARAALEAHAEACGLWDARRILLSGGAANATEGRAALHWAARLPDGTTVQEAARVFGIDRIAPSAHDDIALLLRERDRMRDFVAAVRSGEWRLPTGRRVEAILHVGIGGSHLGPEAAFTALRPFAQDGRALDCRFLSNLDGRTLNGLCAALDPAATLVVVASKSFTTLETMENWRAVRDWLAQALPGGVAPEDAAVALTARPERAEAAGFAPARIFTMPESVGGRWSLTSAMGLTVALALGWRPFAAMLAGAHALDRHFACAPASDNLPVRAGLSDFWMKAVLGASGEVVVPYADALDLFVDHLQQLDLESNGKRVRAADGGPIAGTSAVPLWGRRGTNSQHAFFQMLHQGTHGNFVTFIGVRPGWSGRPAHDRLLLANLLGQASALALGREAAAVRADLSARGLDEAEVERLVPHLVSPGGRASRILLLDRLDPDRFGRLLAFFEHRTFVEGVVFGVDPFDQWGVEFGKRLARTAADLLSGARERAAGGGEDGHADMLDPAARALLARLAAEPSETGR